VIGFKDATAYRFEFLAEILGSALVPAAIQLVFWYALFEVGGVERAGGLDHRAAVQYTILSVLFSQVRGGDHDFDLAEMIRTGQLSAFLLRPVGVVEFTWLRGVAPKLLIAGLCFLLGLALSPLVGARVAGMVLGMGFALLGNLVHYLLGAALASVSFYWEEAYSLLMVKNLVVSILSGELLPLSFFPGAMAWIWKSLPFYLYVYAPVQFASGRWGVAEFLPQLGIALGWLLVATLLVRVSWRVGIRRYQSLGG
jgi:ABC-2 type transport system permease protein